MNANTTETDIETQPPWDLIALLVLAFIVLGWMALAVSYNPSRGAQHTKVQETAGKLSPQN